MNLSTRRIVFATLVGALVFSFAASAAELEEIIVTATKRGEISIQDVPASISAFGETRIERLDAVNFEDFARHVPSLLFVSDGGPAMGNQQLAIRGLNPVGGAGVDTVAQFMDGAPRFGNTPRLFDMQSVEVLRGPQGTLFGSSSLGGTVRYITNKPRLGEFGGNVEMDVYSTNRDNGDSYYAAGALNIPASETIAIRLAGYYNDESGFVNNVRTGRNGVNTVDAKGGRLSVLWQPNERFTLTGIYNYDKIEANSSTAYMPALPGRLNRDSFFDEPAVQDYDLFNLLFDYDFGPVILSGAYADYRNKGTITFDLNTELARDGIPLSRSDNFFNPKSTTTELRLVSNTESRFQWIVGGYYDNLKNPNGEDLFGFANPNLPNVPAPFGPNRQGLPAGEDFALTERRRGNPTQKEVAFFGEVSYEFTEKLTGLLGVRSFDFDITDNTVINDFFGNTQAETDVPGGTWDPFVNNLPTGTTSNSDQFFKVNLTYRATDDLLVYGTFSQGFRVGGFNRSAGVPTTGIPRANAAYKPDSVDNFEFGMNSQWLENRLTANMAVFYVTWKDIQIPVRSPRQPNGGNRRYVVNGGEAEIYGVEGEFAVQDLVGIEGVYANMSFGYTHARLTKDVSVPGVATPFIRDGDVLRRVPEWTYSLAFGYEWELANSWIGYINTDFSHRDKALQGNRPADPAAVAAGDVAPTFFSDSEDIWNTNFGVRSERWAVSLYVRNITNQTPSSFIQSSTAPQFRAVPSLVGTIRPRTVGLEFKFNF